MEIFKLEHARKCIAVAIKKAIELDALVSISIVTPSGFLIAFERMNEAALGPIDISLKKAKTAALFNKDTGILGEKSQPNGPLFGIEKSNDGLITFPGGSPIKNKEEITVAAIGISGSTVENDHLIAKSVVEFYSFI